MKKRIVLFGVFGIMALAPLAHADYEIAFQVGAGAVMPCLDNPNSDNTTGTTACSGSTGGISLVNLTGSSTSPGSPALAEEFSSSGSMTNNNTSGSVTVHIWYLAQGFTMPVTGGGVTGIKYVSNSSGTAVNVTAPTDTLGLESCIDHGAGGTGSSFCTSPYATLTNLVLSYPMPAGSVSNSVNEQFSPLNATYSLEQAITITINAGDSVNWSMSQVLTPVPEPMSIVLLGGILVLTTGAIRRKRSQVSRS